MPDLLYGPEGIAYQSIDVKDWPMTEEQFEEAIDDALEEYVEDEVQVSKEGM